MSLTLNQSTYTFNKTTSIWIRRDYMGIPYSDGDEVEQRLSSIIDNSNDVSVLSDELRAHCTDWPSLYHLSGSRANILRPFESDLRGDVLEIGAGCGAITRYLGECGGNVLALEGSPRRAKIARARTRDLDNVIVICDKFDDFKYEEKFDVITLIGVLEYANLFTEGDNPTLSMLERVRSFLKPNGKLIIAIENQLGLKYFAGAPEDHIGIPMYGIEGRYRNDQPQTFGRKELSCLIQRAGFRSAEFMAPFPDYKLPVSVVAERGFSTDIFDAAALAWQSVHRDPQLPPVLAFSPQLAWQTISKNDIALDLANSFLVIASSLERQSSLTPNTVAWHFTTERKKELCKITKFVETKPNQVEVQYTRLDSSAENPVVGSLLKNFIPQQTEYKRGEVLLHELIRIVSRDGWTAKEVSTFLCNWLNFIATLAKKQNRYVDLANPYSQLPKGFFDYLPQNIIKTSDGNLSIIDIEWSSNEEQETGYIAFRALWVLLRTLKIFGRPAYEEVRTHYEFILSSMRAMGWRISDQDISRWIETEYRIQSEVAGRPTSSDGVLDLLKTTSLPIVNLNQALIENQERIASLNQTITARDDQIKSILNSRSWKLTVPIRKIGRSIRKTRALWRFLKSIITTFGLIGLIKKSSLTLREEGIKGIQRRLINILSYYRATGHIGKTPAIEEKPDSPDLVARVQNEGPKISVIISIYKTPRDMLRQAIESVFQQTYKNWELILIDDFSELDYIRELCESYQTRDARIRYIARLENGNISEANNTGLKHASGRFYTILDHDDTLAHDALYQVAKIVLRRPDADYIYSDEDKLTKDGSSFFGPFFKPDWSPEYMLAMMYTCHMSVFRTSLVKSLGSYNSDFDGAQDYELALRVIRHSNNIEHIPKILYHWRAWENSTAQSNDAKPLAAALAKKAVELHLKEQNENFIFNETVLPGHQFVDFLPRRESLVSIIIPTANGSINLQGKIEKHINAVCESIFSKTSYTNIEIVVIHNGDLALDQIEWLKSHKNLILTEYKSEKFNLAEKINQGARLANGEYLVIMNDDIRVISENWLTLMLGMAQREGVGAVGPKLVFPDETIQHAGVVMLAGLPGHPYYRHPKNSLGYGLGLQVNRNYLAVTGACCMTPKAIFDQLGGYNERYPLNYNDVDYCLRLHKLGFRSVYVCNAHLYHYEGVSKQGGRTVSTEEIQRFLLEWGDEYRIDPFYNINLNQSIPYYF